MAIRFRRELLVESEVTLENQLVVVLTVFDDLTAKLLTITVQLLGLLLFVQNELVEGQQSCLPWNCFASTYLAISRVATRDRRRTKGFID